MKLLHESVARLEDIYKKIILNKMLKKLVQDFLGKVRNDVGKESNGTRKESNAL